MLYVILAFFILLTALALHFCIGRGDESFCLMMLAALLAVVDIGIVVGIASMWGSYNSIRTTADKKIQVLEEQNERVMEQIAPLAERYLGYESDTLKGLRPDPQVLLALSAYPELKGNEFVKAQMEFALKNQREITRLKLKKASLASYKFWIFAGETR